MSVKGAVACKQNLQLLMGFRNPSFRTPQVWSLVEFMSYYVPVPSMEHTATLSITQSAALESCKQHKHLKRMKKERERGRDRLREREREQARER